MRSQTITSGFSVDTQNMEEMRRQLAETSIELEEQRERYKRQVAKQQKDLEANYEQVEIHRNDDKKLRVKINQLENDLSH